MAEHPLNPDEAALWQRVVETVRPVAGRVTTAVGAVGAAGTAPAKPVAARTDIQPLAVAAPARAMSGNTLDASWDRQLARGLISPDRTIDLHGDTLDRAYGRIDAALADAIGAGERAILLITGKPGGDRIGHGRGVIRAVVGDWLAASRHAGRIAALRPAHPRHGGAGALYLILRRR